MSFWRKQSAVGLPPLIGDDTHLELTVEGIADVLHRAI